LTAAGSLKVPRYAHGGRADDLEDLNMRKNAVRFRVIICFGALMALASASQAAASTTIGQLAPPNPPNLCVGGPNDALQASLGGGNP
jgi:hypothetical protein